MHWTRAWRRPTRSAPSSPQPPPRSPCLRSLLLAEALHAVVSCAVHPNAIDGEALLKATSAAATAPTSGAGVRGAAVPLAGGDLLLSSGSGPPSVGVDVAEMLHTWAGSLEACLRTCVIAKEIHCRGVNYQVRIAHRDKRGHLFHIKGTVS